MNWRSREFIYIQFAGTKDGAAAAINGYGVEYVEEYNFFEEPYQPTDPFSDHMLENAFVYDDVQDHPDFQEIKAKEKEKYDKLEKMFPIPVGCF